MESKYIKIPLCVCETFKKILVDISVLITNEAVSLSIITLSFSPLQHSIPSLHAVAQFCSVVHINCIGLSIPWIGSLVVSEYHERQWAD